MYVRRIVREKCIAHACISRIIYKFTLYRGGKERRGGCKHKAAPLWALTSKALRLKILKP